MATNNDNIVKPSDINLDTARDLGTRLSTEDRRRQDNKSISNRIAHVLAENGYLEEMATILKGYDALSEIDPETKATKAFSDSEIENLIGVYIQYCKENPVHDKDPNAVTVQYIRDHMEEIELNY